MMDYYPNKNIYGTFVIATVLIIGAFYFFNLSSFSTELVLTQNRSISKESNSSIDGYRDELDSALAKASMGNKTVIIVIVNKAYVEEDEKSEMTMLDLFVNSFWVGEGTRSLIDHVLLVAVDQIAYDRCMFLRLNCYRLVTDHGVDYEAEKLYMSNDFIKMMWRRTLFLLEVLQRGYNFVFTDSDVMWLRNPFKRLSKDKTEDLQISTDRFNGDPWSEKHYINTGYFFVRSNNRTISLFETWYGMKDNSTGKKEQDVLHDLIRNGIIATLGLRVRFLDTLYFSGFCEDSKDVRVVTTIHANCCRSIHAKVADLKATLSDWKKFKSFKKDSNNNSTMNFKWTHHDSCWQSWGRPTKKQG